MDKQFCININDSKELEIYFNQNQTLEYLLEYLAYNYPEEKICPCFQFIDNKNNKTFEKPKKVIDYLTNTNKIYLKNINDDKRCHCDESYKKYYYKTKLEIIRLLLKEIERLEEYVIEFKKITENLVEENKKLNNNIKMNSEISQIIKKDIPLNINIFDFYDTVVSIKSIGDICNGWEVKMNERLKNNYDKFKNEKNIKIGVIGNSNKGKSFLLSKISKSFLPSGSSIRTEGLSFKYPDLEKYKDKNIILIDSAGLETPVLQESKPFNNDIEKEEENIQNQKDNKNSREDFKAREKLITELFLQNYIINNSDILLIVFGILTYSEQKLINKIKALQKNNKKNYL